MEKIILITGATSGIGKAVAFGLADPNHRLILVAPNPQKGEALREEILQKHPGAQVAILTADLALQADIRQLVGAFHQAYDRLDVLINCAGLVSSRRVETREGIEQTLAVNYLSHYLLATLLTKALMQAPQGRIINVASLIPPFARIHFEDLQGNRRYNGVRAYLQAKVADVMFTYELAEQLKDTKVTVNAIHPGIVRTNLGLETSEGLLQAFVQFCLRFVAISPQQSALRILRLATSPDLSLVSGHYFKGGPTPVRTNRFSYDEAARRKLLAVSQHLTRLTE